MRSCACVLYRRRAVTSRRTEDNLTPQFRIKNWKKHQHYKGRRPPWIKLHAALLDDYEFECLQDDSKMHLIAIWLLASRSRDCHPDGDPLLPEDEPYLTKKAGLKKKVSLTPLFSSGFLVRYQLDSNLIAERKQLVPTETETETETYKEETYKEEVDTEGSLSATADLPYLWNRICTSLPKCSRLTEKRKIHVKARLKERHLTTEWETIFQRIEASPFLTGQNDRNWKADFDWIIKSPDNAVKVLEGKYDGGKNGPGNKGGNGQSAKTGNIKATPGKYAGIGTTVCTDPSDA